MRISDMVLILDTGIDFNSQITIINAKEKSLTVELTAALSVRSNIPLFDGSVFTCKGTTLAGEGHLYTPEIRVPTA